MRLLLCPVLKRLLYQLPGPLIHRYLQRQPPPLLAHLGPRLTQNPHNFLLIVGLLKRSQLIIKKYETRYILEDLRLFRVCGVTVGIVILVLIRVVVVVVRASRSLLLVLVLVLVLLQHKQALLADEPRNSLGVAVGVTRGSAEPRRLLRLAPLELAPPGVVPDARHRVRGAGHLPPAEMLRPDRELKRLRRRRAASGEIAGHFAGVVELVGHRLAGGQDVGVGIARVCSVDGG